MKLAIALALLACVAVASAQTCSSQGVTDQSSCDAKCGGRTNCACSYLLSSCGCAAADGFSFSCTDLSGGNDDFFGGDDDFGGSDFANCGDDGVTDEASCDAQCGSHSNCFCSFTEVLGVQGCSCGAADGFSYTCSSTSVGGDNDDSAVPPTSLIKSTLTAVLGQECAAPLDRALTSSFVKCVVEDNAALDALENDEDAIMNPTKLSNICSNKCIGEMFRAVDILNSTGCGTVPESAIANDPTGIIEGFFGIMMLKDYMGAVGLACTQGNGVFCGSLMPVFDLLMTDPTNFGAAQCQTIVGAGKCLGSYRAFLEADPTGLSDDDEPIDPDMVLSALESVCTAAGVTGITEAAAGTEAPSSLASSSATTVSGVVAAVAAAAVAAILA
ncbi:hypothetical protein PTSG_11260 [Salpingoeca rosetta]|uniref:Uncharacterized protein n=1 Tax=Salpingoeca rosetta (strain ATCC 50818 / BSB-021) TaxID=946362 RepID=F2USW4_SALR5|nr:uncharacterized protein PTSG_11260 [Salpingoeca rosetta]EGD81223.1 hypothetical protein PTSG_11260 [Salpingoeca rosetta]|eukprot:XP_004987757.1 hypothetical protein PTSG_11260 [Salpingoeca rosetta]